MERIYITLSCYLVTLYYTVAMIATWNEQMAGYSMWLTDDNVITTKYNMSFYVTLCLVGNTQASVLSAVCDILHDSCIVAGYMLVC